MFAILILSLASSAIALPTPDTEAVDAKSVKRECDKGVFNSMCFKIGAIALLQRLNKKTEVTLAPGLTLVKDKEEKPDAAAELMKSLPSDPEDKLDKYLLYNMETFMDTHSVKLKLFDESSVAEARSLISEGRRRGGMGGKKGGMGGMMTMAMMMKGTLMSIGLGGLAMLAGKALMTAMMSLVLSAVIGLKSLSSGGKSTTYEIVSKPIYTHSHSHSTAHEDVGGYGHSGYGRNLNARRR